jgi:hypothetical protein
LSLLASGLATPPSCFPFGPLRRQYPVALLLLILALIPPGPGQPSRPLPFQPTLRDSAVPHATGIRKPRLTRLEACLPPALPPKPTAGRALWVRSTHASASQEKEGHQNKRKNKDRQQKARRPPPAAPGDSPIFDVPLLCVDKSVVSDTSRPRSSLWVDAAVATPFVTKPDAAPTGSALFSAGEKAETLKAEWPGLLLLIPQLGNRSEAPLGAHRRRLPRTCSVCPERAHLR